jgi:hypothetical protein
MIFGEKSVLKVYVNLHDFMNSFTVMISFVFSSWDSQYSVQIVVIIFKSIHGLSPVYISDLISTKLQSKYCLRSNNELLLAPKVTKTKKTLGDRAFTAAAPKLFNELPREIRTVTNLNHFKTLIKTFLFRKAYDIV